MTSVEPDERLEADRQGLETVERGDTAAQFDPSRPAAQQLQEWGWDPNSLSPAQLEVMARRYAHADDPLLPHVDVFGRAVSPDQLGVDDLANAWLHANPDINGQTRFLPLIGDDDTRERILSKDAELQRVNEATNAVRPSEIGYRSAHLGGSAEDVSDLVAAADRLKSAVDRVLAIHGRVRELYSADHVSECLAEIGKARIPKLDEYVAALSADAAAARQAVVDTGSGARAAFRGFRDVVDGYREDIARFAARSSHAHLAGPENAVWPQFGQRFIGAGDVGLDEGDPKTSVAAGAAQAVAAGEAMGALFTAVVADSTAVEVPLPGATGTVGGGPSSQGSARGGGGGGSFGGAIAGTEPGSSWPTVQEALSPIAGAGMAPMPAMPQMPQVPSGPTVPPLFADGGPQTGLSAGSPAERPVQDSLEPGRDQPDRRISGEARAADAALASPAVLRPGDRVRPSQLGADMKPLDKDGDGRMDADAIAPTRNNMDLDQDGTPDRVASAVMIGGAPHAVSIDDPRLLEMMNTLGAATPDAPVDVLDAAARAEMPLSGYGQFLDDPMTAKTGDVLTGGKGTGMYLEGGQVLMQDGSVKPLVDVFEFRPPHSGFFRLDLPELPEGDAPGGPGAGAGSSLDTAAAGSAGGGDDAPGPAPIDAPQPAPDVRPAEPDEVGAAEQVVDERRGAAGPPERDLPFPVIETETLPRSW
ncbi:hypothetical protein ACNUDN_30230 [Mycobacterium sp. smrl_JER01]|uniref:hypothetical protein n=1 Tax=Mycobacterium sp. smrl_JER01 TaxID=3402633 RepID=UPI003AD4A456